MHGSGIDDKYKRHFSYYNQQQTIECGTVARRASKDADEFVSSHETHAGKLVHNILKFFGDSSKTFGISQMLVRFASQNTVEPLITDTLINEHLQ
jgi:hypothetical protein